MTEPRELRVLLVMYDLPQWLYKYMHYIFDPKAASFRCRLYFEDWTRVQQSVLLVLTHLEPDAFKASIFAVMAMNSANGKDLPEAINDVVSSANIFVLDVTTADYSGNGLKEGWDWYEQARSQALRSRQTAQLVEGVDAP